MESVSKRHPQNGPTFSKSLAKRRQRPSVASPDQKKAMQTELERETTRLRSFDKLKNKIGLFAALFPDKAPKPIKRRV
jgi:hypothetical protein